MWQVGRRWDTAHGRGQSSLARLDPSNVKWRCAEWGHSFRPAYFRLGTTLTSSIRVQRILALTATATRATEAAICQVCTLGLCTANDQPLET